MKIFSSLRNLVISRLKQRTEAGVSAVVLALCVVMVMVPLGAMAVDLGVQRVAARDMQAVADVIALDLARALEPGKKAGSYDTDSLVGLANDRLTEQSFIGDAFTFGKENIQLGVIDETQYGQPGFFRVAGSDEIPDAVRVFASTDVNFTLATALVNGGVASGGAARSAVATQSEASVCISAGSRLIGFESNKIFLLGPLLKDVVSLDLGGLSTDGMITRDFSIPIAGLMSELNLGTTDDLMNWQGGIGSLLGAAGSVLQQGGGIAQVQLLEALGREFDDLGLTLPGLGLKLGDLLALSAGTPAAGVAGAVNILDLASNAFEFANGSNAYTQKLNIPGVETEVQVLEPAVISCTPDVPASTAGVRLKLRIKNPLAQVLPGIGTLFGNDWFDFDLKIGSGEVTVDKGEIQCGDEMQVGVDAVVHGFSTQASTTLGANVKPLGIPIVNVQFESGIRLAAASTTAHRTLVFTSPDDLPGMWIPEKGMEKAITVTPDPLFKITKTELAGWEIPLVRDAVNTFFKAFGDISAGLVNLVGDIIITPLTNLILPALGLNATQVYAKLLDEPTCGGVQLVG